MGLLEPHGRYRRRHGRPALTGRVRRFHTLDRLRPAGRRVLLRLDLNLPLAEGEIADATRLERALPTLRELMAAGAKIVVLSHLGRPGGQARAELSLAPVARALARRLGRPVAFAADCVGPAASAAVAALAPGGVVMLENLRFHAGEEANDGAFADALAGHGELYVNDAFSVAHRAHASTAALAARLPAAAGRAMQRELEALEAAFPAPDSARGGQLRGSGSSDHADQLRGGGSSDHAGQLRGGDSFDHADQLRGGVVAAIVGGAKVSTKLALLGRLAQRADVLAIGGAMANTFLAASGIATGASPVETAMMAAARAILKDARERGCELLLPRDAVVAERIAAGAPARTVAIDAVPAAAIVLDIGPASVAAIARRLEEAETLIWNGPLGAFELAGFEHGTVALARHAAALTRAGRLHSVAGGGDTAAALARAGVGDDFSYVSSAGGAFLEWLAGHTLPAIAALEAAAR